MERERNNTGLVVAVIILAMLVVGLVGFIVYDKLNNKPSEPNIENNDNSKDDDQLDDNDQSSEEKEEVKEISIKDKLVTSLKFPTKESEHIDWGYQNVYVDKMTRAKKMVVASTNVHWSATYSYGEGDNVAFSAAAIEKEFKKMFGPDMDYYDGPVDYRPNCCTIGNYIEEDEIYIANCGCGGDYSNPFITRRYKAEQSENYIYVYDYVQKISFPLDDEYEVYAVHLYNSNGDLIKIIDYENYESEIYKLMDEGKVETYKWTFKKQSDGKYYFYSGAWEN